MPAPAAALLLGALALSGCAWLPGRAPDVPGSVDVTDDFARSKAIALDFVDAIARLPELDPTRTTLWTSRPPSRFGEILVGALQGAGYDLRLGDESSATLDYGVTPEDGADGSLGSRYTFLVSAGGVRLKRTYRLDGDGASPVSAMLLHGADATVLASSRGPIDALPLGEVDAPLPEDALVAPLPDAVPVVGSSAIPLPNGASDRDDVSGGMANASLATAPPTPTDPPRKRNFFETGRSNYAELLADYDTLSTHIMVFPNDSLRMGGDNKRLASGIVERFDPERDVISVIGCSHGPTALKNGNEVLATGRSYRVKEEFMLAGIDADLVLEEGCWAGEAYAPMPTRGVLVTHKRRTTG